jgi:hypothetical protein
VAKNKRFLPTPGFELKKTGTKQQGLQPDAVREEKGNKKASL